MAETPGTRREGPRFEDYLRILRERGWIIILCAAVFAGGSLLLSLRDTSAYTTSANLIPLTSNVDSAVVGTDLVNYNYMPAQLVRMDLAVLTLNPSIAEAVKAQLNSNRSPEELVGMISAGFDPDTDVITIRGVSPFAEEAATVANAFADQFIAFKQNEDRAALVSAQELIQRRLGSLSDSEKASEYGLMLQEKYESLLILESIQDGGYAILRRASVPGAPIPSETARNALVAMGVGIVLGIVIALLIELLDKRIRDEKTLEQVAGLPVLTSVPAVSGRWISSKNGKRSGAPVGFEGPGAVLLESFRMLRSTLQYFDVDGGLRTIMVTSGLPQEGKTITTVNLGVSLALSGKRVIILESDLRRPMVHEYLALDNQVGLSTALAGKVSAEKALQLVRMDPYIPQKARRDPSEPASSSLRKNLYCMPSGPLPPNPAELLGSARMQEIISELQGLADYVLIDTSPVLPVSDAVTVARWVDAIILTARIGSTTRDQLEEVRNLLDRTGTRVIGVVACGVKSRAGYYGKRAYGYSYAEQPES